MVRPRLVLLLLIAASRCSLLAQPGQLDASETLFTVLAAINAAGYNAEADSASNHPLRARIRAEIARRNPPSVEKIREFMRAHRQENDTWELRQYIAYGLMADNPPEFKFRAQAHLLPPDVAALEPLGPLLKDFYREAGIAELWKQSQPAFDEAIARYHAPTSRAVAEVNAYLRNPTSGGYLGRRFQIYVDLLGAPNQIQVHNILDEYFIVLTNSVDPQVEDIRQAYLHYMLDPLATKYVEDLEAKKALGDYAQGAPYLADHYKNDFLLLATRSLIEAIKSRMIRGPAEAKKAMVDRAMGDGFVLAAHFAEQLPAYEKQEQSMRLYFPELVKSIDLKREEQRLEKLQFSQERPVRKAKVVVVTPPPLTGAEKALEEAEALYSQRQIDKAREAYMRAEKAAGDKNLRAKAYYGLARIAALRKDPDLAEELFEKTLDLDPEPVVKGWTLVYLARLSEAAGEPEKAGGYYKAALEVEGASAGAREAAKKGIEAAPKQKQ